MDFFDKIKFNFDRVGYIKKLINEWEPSNCKTEKDFEKSLYNILHTHLTHLQITKQYAIGRIKADIVIDEEIIIEIKINLTSRSNYQRLIGQLMEYKTWTGKVIVLLIGKTDINFTKDLKNFIEKECNTSIIDIEKFTLIEKSV